MVAKSTLKSSLSDIAAEQLVKVDAEGEKLFKYELRFKNVDTCKFDVVKQYHDAVRISKNLPAFNNPSFADELIRMHAERPLGLAVSNEFEMLSGLELIPSAKCNNGPERK